MLDNIQLIKVIPLFQKYATYDYYLRYRLSFVHFDFKK
ncbi:hypothetical protein CAPGI0001_1186 [Capnocytophaga gingivalis ATCC 33624]|nr:hypothetical protein CAPGI0001_1186 [Capnocytophaga gingivalis ATCC 33624]